MGDNVCCETKAGISIFRQCSVATGSHTFFNGIDADTGIEKIFFLIQHPASIESELQRHTDPIL